MPKLTPPFIAASLGAFLTVGACNSKPTNVIAPNDDPQAAQLKNAPAVAPPPMIQVSRSYRCDDNSLVYADFYTNNTVSVRASSEGAATLLAAKDGKPPYTGQGYSISANSAHITYSAPGKADQGCDA